MKLNKAQQQAVNTIDGPVMVIAGPGTGKTEIIAHRIAKILKATDTPPDAILALTFTESGANDFIFFNNKKVNLGFGFDICKGFLKVELFFF